MGQSGMRRNAARYGRRENFKREREDYLCARAHACMCARVCKAREKGRQNRSGSEGDEGERPWVRKKGRSGVPMENRRESVRAGWQR